MSRYCKGYSTGFQTFADFCSFSSGGQRACSEAASIFQN
jgi:hypothetical protein